MRRWPPRYGPPGSAAWRAATPRESPPEALAEPLTPRESEVLQLLADGLSNKAIARDLGIREHTVKFHVNAIMTKLDAQSRTDAVVRVEARRGVPATGVLWNDTLIVTAHHALERDDHIPAGLGDGRILTASLVGRDPTTDIAVLRVEGTGLRAPVWADPTDLRVGHLVLALGRPGRTVQATLGVVSALGADWRTPMGGQLDHCLQTDVLMYPGFSGGPLVNAMGQVLGMNTSAVLRGISLTIPTPTIRRVVETLLAHGRMRRGYLGIGSQPVRLPESMAQHVGQDTGLLVVSVEPGSPADQAGLLLGDVIVAFDGQPTRTLEDLLSLLDEQRIGKSSPVRLVRGGQAVEAVITVGER
jgi:S1-C subfamily serine protease